MTTMNKFTSDNLLEDMHCRFSKGASRNKGSNRDRRYLITGEVIPWETNATEATSGYVFLGQCVGGQRKRLLGSKTA